ncbi:hypothetical protein F511_37974 [Dorcoceras hygrometricum]|uniref:Uncharacterized protein n=1 Tax=Dorcoceras hygrometricum TaxID=472368 RepID=A0A2Z7CID0_9LAMI|nr:hypothetical protein F511_37974 [Dorcoceras hygrometricum]
MSDSSTSSSSYDSAVGAPQPSVVGSHSTSQGIFAAVSRHWHDVFWLLIFMANLVVVGFALAVLGLNRFKQKDRLNIDRYTMGFLENKDGLIEDYWPLMIDGIDICWFSIGRKEFLNFGTRTTMHLQLELEPQCISIICMLCLQISRVHKSKCV